jgi:PHD/YefM family antitoxin component YafN of YafNO toxin-antitoxin module
MSTTISSQELKRRGISAVDEQLSNGPVHVILHNKPSYVVLAESSYTELINELAEARLAASENDLLHGRTQKGDSRQLMKELLDDE